MEFPRTSNEIALGDLVIMYETFDSIGYAHMEAGGIYNSKFGAFHHKDMVGRPFGTKV